MKTAAHWSLLTYGLRPSKLSAPLSLPGERPGLAHDGKGTAQGRCSSEYLRQQWVLNRQIERIGASRIDTQGMLLPIGYCVKRLPSDQRLIDPAHFNYEDKTTRWLDVNMVILSPTIREGLGGWEVENGVEETRLVEVYSYHGVVWASDAPWYLDRHGENCIYRVNPSMRPTEKHVSNELYRIAQERRVFVLWHEKGAICILNTKSSLAPFQRDVAGMLTLIQTPQRGYAATSEPGICPACQGFTSPHHARCITCNIIENFKRMK